MNKGSFKFSLFYDTEKRLLVPNHCTKRKQKTTYL